MDNENLDLTPPPFNAAAALTQMKRQLRDLKLSERGTGFALKGCTVVDLAIAADHIDARLVRRTSRAPEWIAHRLRNGAEVRSFIDTVKRQMGRWSTDE